MGQPINFLRPSGGDDETMFERPLRGASWLAVSGTALALNY